MIKRKSQPEQKHPFYTRNDSKDSSEAKETRWNDIFKVPKGKKLSTHKTPCSKRSLKKWWQSSSLVKRENFLKKYRQFQKNESLEDSLPSDPQQMQTRKKVLQEREMAPDGNWFLQRGASGMVKCGQMKRLFFPSALISFTKQSTF